LQNVLDSLGIVLPNKYLSDFWQQDICGIDTMQGHSEKGRLLEFQLINH